jgi:hypothetical protein
MATKKSSNKAAKKASKKLSSKNPASVAPAGLVKAVKAAMVKHAWSGSIEATAFEGEGLHCGPGEVPTQVTFKKDGQTVTELVCMPV